MPLSDDSMVYPAGTLPSSLMYPWDAAGEVLAALREPRGTASPTLGRAIDELGVAIDDRDEHWWPSDAYPALSEPPANPVRGYLPRPRGMPQRWRPLWMATRRLYLLLRSPHANSDRWWGSVRRAGNELSDVLMYEEIELDEEPGETARVPTRSALWRELIDVYERVGMAPPRGYCWICGDPIPGGGATELTPTKYGRYPTRPLTARESGRARWSRAKYCPEHRAKAARERDLRM